MKINNRWIKRETALLGLIFVVLSTSTLVWSITDKSPPVWDPADHMSAAYDYYRYVALGDLGGLAKEFFIEPHFYAPLVHIVTAFVFLVAGASRVSGIVVNLLSLALLLFSVNWMARALEGAGRNPLRYDASSEPGGPGEEARKTFYPGVVAALLAGSYHFGAWLIHDAFLDFPLTAIVAASFACLINAGDFQDRKKAILFGIAAGLGLLTKQTFAFFFVLPAIYVALRVLRSRSLKGGINLLFAAWIALAVAAIWYLPHLNDVIAIYNVNREGAVNENEAPLFTLMSNLFYPHALLSAQLQVPFGMLFLSGLVYSLIRRRKENALIYLWLLSGIVMFTLIANKDVRYTVPVTPAAAILSVSWLGALHRARSDAREAARSGRGGSRLSNRRRASTIFYAASACSIAAWAFVSFFNAQWPAPGNGYYIDTPRFRWMVFARNYYSLDHRPVADDWNLPAIVEAVASEGSKRQGEGPAARQSDGRPTAPRETVSPSTREAEDGPSAGRPTLGVIVNLPHLNPSAVGLYSRLLSPGRAGAPLVNVDYIVVDSALDRLEGCEYLLVRTGLDRAEWVGSTERAVEEFIRKNPRKVARVASFPIPLDQAEAVIYRCGGIENE
ncbi:MAG TPA: glycosyltransferase family 39 protein [Blastocatellia bacterium]|nr:glycosyltransferase family 39 protein [Blastocatellia bacterium]